jgi:hypothetical protein
MWNVGSELQNEKNSQRKEVWRLVSLYYQVLWAVIQIIFSWRFQIYNSIILFIINNSKILAKQFHSSILKILYFRVGRPSPSPDFIVYNYGFQ